MRTTSRSPNSGVPNPSTVDAQADVPVDAVTGRREHVLGDGVQSVASRREGRRQRQRAQRKRTRARPSLRWRRWRRSTSCSPRAATAPACITAEAAARHAAGGLLIDVRVAEQRRADGTVPGALVLSLNHIDWRLDPTSAARIPEATGTDIDVVLFCDEGYVSSLAAARLHDLGLHRATDMIGGFQAWRAAGLPVDRDARNAASSTGLSPWMLWPGTLEDLDVARPGRRRTQLGHVRVVDDGRERAARERERSRIVRDRVPQRVETRDEPALVALTAPQPRQVVPPAPATVGVLDRVVEDAAPQGCSVASG